MSRGSTAVRKCLCIGYTVIAHESGFSWHSRFRKDSEAELVKFGNGSSRREVYIQKAASAKEWQLYLVVRQYHVACDHVGRTYITAVGAV
eukprot:1852494-Pleurochrysis_carterae.AAC.6